MEFNYDLISLRRIKVILEYIIPWKEGDSSCYMAQSLGNIKSPYGFLFRHCLLSWSICISCLLTLSFLFQQKRFMTQPTVGNNFHLWEGYSLIMAMNILQQLRHHLPHQCLTTKLYLGNTFGLQNPVSSVIISDSLLIFSSVWIYYFVNVVFYQCSRLLADLCCKCIFLFYFILRVFRRLVV